MQTIAVLCHLYYEDSLTVLKPYFDNLKSYDTMYFFNICSEVPYKDALAKKVQATFRNAVVTCSPNLGKDIGGKLLLIDTYLKLCSSSRYLVLVHDKNSPHTAMGAVWRTKLLRILEAQNVQRILKEFAANRSVGLIANKNLINNEYNAQENIYTCTSSKELMICRTTYQITASNHNFVGGTMFWTRSEIYESFFSVFNPLEIRKTLERGNVLDTDKGTFTHAWERMLSWIISDKGYTLKGI